MLRHTNLEYRVIANHLSASGLWLAPQLTHAPSDQCDDRGAGDTMSPSSTRSRKPLTTSTTSPFGLAFILLISMSSRPCSSRTPSASWTTNLPPASVTLRRPSLTLSKLVHLHASILRSSSRRWSRMTSLHQKPPRLWTRSVGTLPHRITLHHAPSILHTQCALFPPILNLISTGGCTAASVI